MKGRGEDVNIRRVHFVKDPALYPVAALQSLTVPDLSADGTIVLVSPQCFPGKRRLEASELRPFLCHTLPEYPSFLFASAFPQSSLLRVKCILQFVIPTANFS